MNMVMKMMKILKWLSVTDRYTKNYLDNLLAPLGINSSQHMYLVKICKYPGISQDSLLNSFYVHPSNIVRMVSSLEKKGFITKEPCEDDKRTWRLYPTPKAFQILDHINQACTNTENMITATLTEEEKQLFTQMLIKVGKQITNATNVKRTDDEFDE